MSKNISKHQQDTPKYLKPKESNISKSNRKSKHKHKYEECLIQYDDNFNGIRCTHISSYCTICGKIGGYLKNGKYTKEIELFQKQGQEEDKYFRVISISGEELYERYHDKIPVFFLDNISNRYVVLGQNSNSERE